MIRRWFSNFVKQNKSKLIDLGTKLIIVAIVVFIATIMLSINNNTSPVDNSKEKELYVPEKTILKGKDVSEEQYVKDQNAIDKFLEYCNNGQVEEAYNLLTEDCKKNMYETIDIFKESYYDIIFTENKEYNIQAWVSNSKYTVYRIRYTEDILATGQYNGSEIFFDYITLIKNNEKEEISIGSFVMSEEMNKVTEQDGIEVTVTKKTIYMEDEEYELYIKNNTEKTILMDTLVTRNNIKLVADDKNTFQTNIGLIPKDKLIIAPKAEIQLTMKFKKSVTSSKKSKYIEFFQVIRDYESYINDEENYTDKIDLKINI